MSLFQSRKDNSLPKPLWLAAAAVGLLRAFSGSKQPRPRERSQNTPSDRGRTAARPSDIPAKGWWDIGWRVFKGIQEDRVLLVAAGVTFYGLLALFPAVAALVSLYGVFTDPASISEQLRLLSGFLPDGALEVIGDQVKRISAQGRGTLSFTFVGTLLLSFGAPTLPRKPSSMPSTLSTRNGKREALSASRSIPSCLPWQVW